MKPDKPTKTDNQILAIWVIIGTVFILSFGDAVIKNVHSDLVLWQIFVVRSWIALIVLLIILGVKFRSISLRPKDILWTLIRSLSMGIMWIAYYVALPHIPLSIAASAYYTAPIFITLFSALLIGDRVNIWGWMAVVIGFCGVVLILKPSTEAFNLYALLPVLSAVLYALSMILTRTKCRDEHPLILSAGLNVAFIFFGLIATFGLEIFQPANQFSAFLSPKWGEMNMTAWMLLVGLSGAILIGSIGAAIAYQRGKPSIIGIFDFSYVGFAVFWGFLFFSETPEPTGLIGMIMIVAAGMLTMVEKTPAELLRPRFRRNGSS